MRTESFVFPSTSMNALAITSDTIKNITVGKVGENRGSEKYGIEVIIT